MDNIIISLQALLLGIIEGITEFIPVSSTGHLILIVDILQFSGPPGKVFEIVIQLGAILAICWLYRQKLLHISRTITSDKSSQHFVFLLVIAFLPAAILGVMFHGFIKSVLFSPIVVSCSLVVGGIIILVIEKFKPTPTTHHIHDITIKTALLIGLAQSLAMIPGTSRSGATIMGALCLKLDRKTATEFSFFLAIPTMLGATVYDIYKNYTALSVDDAGLIALGFISAFISAMFVVKTVIAFIERHGFAPFAWYRIALGSIMLLILL